MNADDIRAKIDHALLKAIPQTSKHSDALVDAMAWSTLGGGKRLRGMLTCTTALAFGSTSIVAPVDLAVAIELMHAYSLVHDDLPAMDDADLRRGKTSTHKKFGEAIAILTGDALQTLAFETVMSSSHLSDSKKIRATQILSNAAGWAGMVGGQAWDISEDRKPQNETELSTLQLGKTGEIFVAATMLGLISSDNDLDGKKVKWARNFGSNLGCVFQMIDDLIDTTQSKMVTGKPKYQDRELGRVTYVSLLGLEGTRQRVAEIRSRIFNLLEVLPSMSKNLLVKVVNECIDRRT